MLEVLHRSGNVHDSNGAQAFILHGISLVRRQLLGVRIELRMDGAFFRDAIVSALEAEGVDYTISVPFERFTELKFTLEQRTQWHRLDAESDYFELSWKPKSWAKHYRFVFVRQRVAVQDKAPIRLDLFVPHVYGYDFKVVLSNKRLRAAKLVAYHNGRGSQEAIFAELKSRNEMAYVRGGPGVAIRSTCSVRCWHTPSPVSCR